MQKTIYNPWDFQLKNQGTEVDVYTSDYFVYVRIHLGSRTFESTNTVKQVGSLSISQSYAPPVAILMRASNVGGIQLGISSTGEIMYTNTRSGSVTTSPTCLLIYPKNSAMP